MPLIFFICRSDSIGHLGSMLRDRDGDVVRCQSRRHVAPVCEHGKRFQTQILWREALLFSVALVGTQSIECLLLALPHVMKGIRISNMKIPSKRVKRSIDDLLLMILALSLHLR